MKSLLIALALLVGQVNTMQSKPVVHLPPHQDRIGVSLGGKLLELANSPAAISLPVTPPKANDDGTPWTIDIKNLGPAAVTVTGSNAFKVQIMVNQAVQIFSNGSAYILKH